MMTQNKSSILLFLSELMEMDNHTSKTVGFAEIMKVDTNTFTIKSIDEEEFVNSMGKEFVDELVIEDDGKES